MTSIKERAAVSICAGVAQYLGCKAHGGFEFNSFNIMGTSVDYALGSGVVMIASSLANTYVQDYLIPMITKSANPDQLPVIAVVDAASNGGLFSLATMLLDRNQFSQQGIPKLVLQGALAEVGGIAVYNNIKAPLLGMHPYMPGMSIAKTAAALRSALG